MVSLHEPGQKLWLGVKREHPVLRDLAEIPTIPRSHLFMKRAEERGAEDLSAVRLGALTLRIFSPSHRKF